MHAACRALLESDFSHRLMDETTRTHIVRTRGQIRQAEVAEIVRDGPAGSGDLFSATRLKVDAQSKDLKALDWFLVFVGHLPRNYPCRVKAQIEILQLLPGFQSDVSTMAVPIPLRREFRKPVAPHRHAIGACRKIRKHKRAVWAGAHDTLRTGGLRCLGIGRGELDLSLGDGFAGIGAGDATQDLPQRQLVGLGIVLRLGRCNRGWSQQEYCAQRSCDAECETRRLAFELRVHRTCPDEHHTPSAYLDASGAFPNRH